MKRISSRATSFDVAALAGVSQSAVSRAFTPGSSIAEEKRAKVLEAARKLNYVPNSIASSLTTKRTNIIALILGNMGNPFYVHVLHEFSRRLQALGRQVLIFTVDPGSESDEAILRALQYQIDGVILTAAQLSTRMTSLCHDRGIPIVLFNRYIPGSDASGVRCDNVGGGRLIAEAFLAALPASIAGRIVLLALDEPIRVDAVLHEGDADRLAALSQRVASIDGPIIAVHSVSSEGLASGREAFYADGLVEEVAVSVNTAAAGGNASLMSIG